MKTLQHNLNNDTGEECETYLWLDKSAKDVLREAYHDRCVVKPVNQPKSTRSDIVRPTTYTVYDRSDCGGREEEGEEVGTLVELP